MASWLDWVNALQKNNTNHRVLSQAKGSYSDYLDLIATENSEVFFQKNRFLSENQARLVLKTFLPLNGYFEFVFGEHPGKTELVATGFLPAKQNPFPEKLWENCFFQVEKRFK